MLTDMMVSTISEWYDAKHRKPSKEEVDFINSIVIEEWIEFLVHLFQFHSVRTTAFDNRNAVTTGLYWLSKVFLVVDDIQSDIVFSGKVWIDETYFPRWKSESATKKRQAAQRAVEKSVLRMLCNRRKAMRAVSLRRGG